MKWKGRRTSRNIDDRRGRARVGAGGGAGGGAMRISGLGAVVLIVAGLFFGFDVTPFLGGSGQVQAPTGRNIIDDQTEEFIGVVLADTETVWGQVFERSGLVYDPPILVLYEGRTNSACGTADAGMGPFYCPGGRQIFLDTSFFRVMEQRLGARGDFAQAYVIAHEVAHHVQNSLGTLGRVNAERARVSTAEANALSVRIELQADCYSGVWARAVDARFGALEPGDIQEAMKTAAAIGDDALQRAASGTVVPDSFTHGTSVQRQRWFMQGYETGDPGTCDTFAARRL